MKKSILALCLIFTVMIGYSQSRCGTCNGNGKLICVACSGYGVINTWNPYYNCYQPVPCGSCSGYGALICGTCRGNGYVSDHSNTSFRGIGDNLISDEVNVQKCNGHGGSICSCKKYVGYKIPGTKTYIGPCRNYVNGHTCGHSPKAHGLSGRMNY